MSLKIVSVPGASFITFVECDICGNIFSRSMIIKWPLCNEGKPHEKMESNQQEEAGCNAPENTTQT